MRKRPITKVRVYNFVLFVSVILFTLYITYLSFIGIVGKNSNDTLPTPPVEEEITKPTTKPVEEPEIEEPVYNYTEEELDLLARLIYSESGSESYDIKLMVGSVVVNRMDDPYFPNTLREVIYQKNQFSVTKIKIDGVIMIDRPADEESKKAAYEILNYGSILPQKVQVFYVKSIKTGWVATREPYCTMGNTTFAYIYPKGEKQ